MHKSELFAIILLINEKRGDDMEIMNRICIKAARVYRTLNKPVVRSNVDAGFDLYSSYRSNKPMASFKIKDLPEIKLLDLILAICTVKIIRSTVKKVMNLFD